MRESIIGIWPWFRLLPLMLAGAFAGCSTASGGGQGAGTAGEAAASQLQVCHGFDCRRKSRVDIGPAAAARFTEIMAGADKSDRAERDAVRRAVAYFEKLSTAAIGIVDAAESGPSQAGEVGQMDCIDESANTHALLTYLKDRRLIRRHEVDYNRARGILVDGRYPHATAVLRDGEGRLWAVDSWYEPAGGLPDVMPFEEWRQRGVLGER